MALSNIDLFSVQLQDVVRKFPNLNIRHKDGFPLVKGIIDIQNDEKEIVRSFSIEIHYKKGFPYRFPKLFEVGGDIPNIADWHKYESSACCITVEADEILKCKNGITVLQFIERHAIPYFANQIHRILHGFYKNGEYAHNAKGTEQFYSELFSSTDHKKWIEYYEIVFKRKKAGCGRNDLCFCGSSKKYKQCHLKVFETLTLIGKEQVLKDFKIIAQ
jgi:hypothetical protein